MTTAPRNDLPSILKVGTIPTVDTMEIRTEVLDPITATNSQVVFQIPKTGILDSGSFLQLAVDVNNADGFFPLNTGIHSLIESVFLKVGSKVISSNTDYAHYTTAVRQTETPEHRAYVDMVKSGACGDRWGHLASGRIAYRDLDYTATTGANTDEATVPAFIRPTTDPKTTPVFMVQLSQLIPMMKARQLPLFAIKEHIYLEVNFRQHVDAGDILCVKDGGTNPTVSPSLTNIKFISDHLYYSDDQMDMTAKQIFSSEGLSILYEDLLVTNAQVPAVDNPTAGTVVPQSIERQVAVSGKTVRNIMISDKDLNANHPLLGKYFSKADRVEDELNFRINDQRLFDRNLVSASRKYEELTQVFGKPLMQPNQIYSLDSDTNKAQVFHPIVQNSVYIGKIEEHQLPDADSGTLTADLRGTSHYAGVDLTTTGFNVLGNGKKIGVKPILVNKTYQRVNGGQSAKEMRIFTAVEKIAVMRNGEVLISA